MRTEGDLIKVNDWLLPLSWIYGSIVRFRNWLFDIGLKKSRAFSIPVISVGNITNGHIQGLFLLKGNPIGPLDLIKEITDLLGQGDQFFF